jgi:branched-chain amino acid aminotransferase
MAPGLNYGQQVFEGLKAFRHPTGRIALFRPHQNARRMQRSAKCVSMPPVPEDFFIECVRLAVAANAEFVPPHHTGAAMYVRPLLFGSSAQLGLSPPDEYRFVVFVMPTGVYHGQHAVDALILEDFDRAAPEGTGAAKVGGNYAPVIRHSERAHRDGFGITLHLDSKTRSEVDEFSTSAFIGVRKDPSGAISLVTPDSRSVIESVTAASVCDIAEHIFGYRVERRRLPYEEIHEFSEVMAAGTAAALVPISSITRSSRNDRFEFDSGGEGRRGGEVFFRLLQTLRNIQLGTIPDQFGWLMDIGPLPEGWRDSQRAQSNGAVPTGS